MNPAAEKIREKARELHPFLSGLRRHLHANPELSFKEFRTSGYLLSLFRQKGFDVKEGIAGTGFLVTLKGGKTGPVRVLRADMDALPITEKNEVPYRSLTEGVMHACGHDVHMTCVVGAMLILQELGDELEGTVQAIFQPGEEVLPGGASLVLAEKPFQGDTAFILGQHVFPELPAGKAGFRPGPYMASTDELRFHVKGKGGHAALPHRNIDPVKIAASLITALHQVNDSPEAGGTPTVLAVGKVIAEGATNVIPDEVYMEGTFRTMNEEWRMKAHEYIRGIARNTAAAAGGECKVEITKGYPVLVNDENVTRQCISLAGEYLGKENVVDLETRMTAEDFAWYTREMKGCFYRLGTASPDGSNSHSVHSPLFDIDESALLTGSGLMAWLAWAGK